MIQDVIDTEGVLGFAPHQSECGKNRRIGESSGRFKSKANQRRTQQVQVRAPMNTSTVKSPWCLGFPEPGAVLQIVHAEPFRTVLVCATFEGFRSYSYCAYCVLVWNVCVLLKRRHARLNCRLGCMHLRIHTYVHACKHSYAPTYTHDTHTHAHPHTDIHTYRQADRQTDKSTHPQTDIPTVRHTWILAYLHTYMHAYACSKCFVPCPTNV